MFKIQVFWNTSIEALKDKKTYEAWVKRTQVGPTIAQALAGYPNNEIKKIVVAAAEVDVILDQATAEASGSKDH